MSDAPGPDRALLSHAVEHSPDGVVIVDGDGLIVYANPAVLAMSGHEDLTGRTVDELVPGEVRAAHGDLRRTYLERPARRPMGAGSGLSLQRSDGTCVPVEISLSPLDDGRGHVVAAVRDITDRLENQRRLAMADEQLALVGERERIGRDLHDVVLQHLYGMGLSVQATAATAAGDVADRLESVVDDVDRIIAEVRTIVFTLGPAGHRGALGQELADVVAQASRVLGFTPSLRLDGPVESVLSDEMRTDMVASMREALGNVARHAAASSAQVSVAVIGDRVRMAVADDGVGPPATTDGLVIGNGLVNLQRRAAAFGGGCELGPAQDGPGAELVWWVPY